MTHLLATIKGVIFDGDGVLFSIKETRDNTGQVLKVRDFHDGQGISYLRHLGIRVLFATGETQPMPTIVRKLNELPSAKTGKILPVEYFEGLLGKSQKVEAIESWLLKHSLTWEECAYLGDDMTDYEAMQKAGLRVAPANSTRRIREIAHAILKREGGDGAIREFAEMVLDARGVDERTLPLA